MYENKVQSKGGQQMQMQKHAHTHNLSLSLANELSQSELVGHMPIPQLFICPTPRGAAIAAYIYIYVA